MKKEKILLFTSESTPFFQIPIKQFKQFIRELERIKPGSLKIINVSEKPKIAKRYRIDALPALIVRQKRFIGKIRTEDIINLPAVAQMKDEFLSVASHELRTPMTAIKGFLDMVLKEEVGKIPNPKIRDYLQLAYEGNERMIKLVNDMLNVSRIEEGRMKFILEEIQIENVIENSIVKLSKISHPKSIYLKFAKPKKDLPKIIADKDKVDMVLNNLIGNAIKFTEKGGVTILAKVEDKSIVMTIKDTGVGIAKEDKPKLFKKFSQIETANNRSAKGTGLGLYITKQIAQKLGGKIWFKSAGRGKGSTFFFSLPIKGSPASKKAVERIEYEASIRADQK